MSDVNMQTDQVKPVHTNLEYILPEVEAKQPPVLKSVAKAIVVETAKDFFGSIFGFFMRYIKHFGQCIAYFFVPSLQKKPFHKLDYKQNAQHTFEFVIIVLALVVFMEKLDWIPQTTSDLIEVYGNDLLQKFVELYFFILFASVYLLSAALSIFSGRLFRIMFKPNISRDESDILSNYLNNAFFSIAAAVSFVLRCMAAMATHEEDSIMIVLVSIFVPVAAIGTLIWAFRFSQLHGLKVGKGILFGLTTLIFYTVLFFFVSLIIAALFLAI